MTLRGDQRGVEQLLAKQLLYPGEIARLAEYVKAVEAERNRLRAGLEDAQTRLGWIERDRREPDKTLCNVASARRVIFDALDENRDTPDA
jgi:hypothetical protein